LSECCRDLLMLFWFMLDVLTFNSNCWCCMIFCGCGIWNCFCLCVVHWLSVPFWWTIQWLIWLL